MHLLSFIVHDVYSQTISFVLHKSTTEFLELDLSKERDRVGLWRYARPLARP